MTTTLTLAQALDTERQRQGMSVTDLINRTGVSRAAVYRLLKGEDVQLTTLLAVTDVLGLDVVTLRSAVASAMPDNGSPALARPMPLPAVSGPLSAVAARAARLDEQFIGKPESPRS